MGLGEIGLILIVLFFCFGGLFMGKSTSSNNKSNKTSKPKETNNESKDKKDKGETK